MILHKYCKLFILLSVLLITQTINAQKPENWTKSQLLDPATLAKAIETGKDVPVIICVGPGAPIPKSIDIGMAKDAENMEKLKKELSAHAAETSIVLYCGCCPFEHCPNVRPAIDLLNEMKFTNYKLLNLPKNIKADWIDKGYPVAKQ